MESLKPALKLVKEFEGCRLYAYRDQVGIPTIGYGTTSGVQMGMVITQEKADEMCLKDIETRANKILQYCPTRKPNDNQLCALVSLCYNIGLGALRKSTLLRMWNEGASHEAVADEFLVWDRAGGEVVPGLERRRKAEKALFLATNSC